jgi:hypothetical protein
MGKRVILITIGLTVVGGTALACNEYTKPKVQKATIRSGDSVNHNKTCTNVVIGKGDQRICPPKATATPTVTPKPTSKPQGDSYAHAGSEATTATPAASQTVKSAAPAVLPSASQSAAYGRDNQ